MVPSWTVRPDRGVFQPTRRQVLAAGAAGTAGLLLAGCGRKSGSGSKTVNFLHNETDPPSVKFFKKAISQYEKSHPGVKINMQLVSTDDRLEKLKSLQASRRMPGLFKLDASDRYTYTRQKIIVSLDDLVSDIGKNEFVEGSLTPIDGTVYDLPYTINQFTVPFYRTDILARYSLTPAKTWKELASSAKSDTRDTNGDGKVDVYGTVIPGAQSKLTTLFFSTILWSNGGMYFDADFNVVLDKGDAAASALNDIVGLAAGSPPGIASYSNAELTSAYLSGAAAQEVFAPRLIANIVDQHPDLLPKTKAEPLLVGDSGIGVGYSDVNSFAIPDSKYTQDDIDVAKGFLKFIVTGDQLRDFSATAYPHLIPPLKSTQQELLTASNALNKSAPELAKRCFDLTNTMDFPFEAGATVTSSGLKLGGTVNPHSDAIVAQNIGCDMVQDVIVNKMSPSEAVKKGAAALRAAVQEQR